MINKYKWVYN